MIHRDRWKPYELFKLASHQLSNNAAERSIDLLDWLTRALQARIDGVPAPALRN